MCSIRPGPSSRMNRRDVVARAVAGFAAVAWLLPIGYLVVLSLAGEWPADRVWPTSVTGERWARLASERGDLVLVTIRSIVLALVVSVISTALGFVSSKSVAESPRVARWLALAHLPFGFSPVILGACLSYFALRLGWSGSFAGVALAHISVATAFALVFLSDVWTPERRALEGVARTLGASPVQTWLRVLWPACRPRVLVCGAQVFFFSWMQYGLTLTIGAGKVRTLPLRVYDFVFEADPGYAAVAALILILPIVFFLLAAGRPSSPSRA